jgi:hypothetical protein
MNRSKPGDGQTSIDFLTGMTLFVLTLFFSLNFLFGMVQPYTDTGGDRIQVADRASDRLHTDVLSSEGSPPGYLNYTHTSEFFEDMTESEIRNSLGIPETRRFNVTLSSDYTSYGPKNGLLAYWPLNERRSEEARDVTANTLSTPLHGSIEGNVTTDVRGISSSGAYRFNDAEAAVNISEDPQLNPADPGNMTLSAWVRPEGTQPTYATVAAKGLNNGYQIHLENRRPTFERGTGGEAQSSNPLDNGEWYHIVAVYNSTASDEMSIYVNGEFKDSDSDTIGAAPGDPFGIGNNLQTSSRHFNGSIDEVRLYERPLSPSEIRGMYKSAGVLSPEKPDPSVHNTLVNTTYKVGEEVPSRQDIASVSTRTRVGYIGDEEEAKQGIDVHRVEFPVSVGSPLAGDSLDEISIDYGSGAVDVSPLVDACADSPNARSGTSPPCPGLVTSGIDGDGDLSVDPGRDATDDVECCPPSDGLMTGGSSDVLEVEFAGNYNLFEGDTVIAEFPVSDPDADFACKNAEVDINGEGIDKTLNVCGDDDKSSDIGVAEIKVTMW